MLQDKVILITGSSRGIGAAAARLAQAYGATVILHGKTVSRELKSLARELSAFYIYCDVANKRAVQKNVASVMRKFGRIDALVI